MGNTQTKDEKGEQLKQSSSRRLSIRQSLLQKLPVPPNLHLHQLRTTTKDGEGQRERTGSKEFIKESSKTLLQTTLEDKPLEPTSEEEKEEEKVLDEKEIAQLALNDFEDSFGKLSENEHIEAVKKCVKNDLEDHLNVHVVVRRPSVRPQSSSKYMRLDEMQRIYDTGICEVSVEAAVELLHDVLNSCSTEELRDSVMNVLKTHQKLQKRKDKWVTNHGSQYFDKMIEQFMGKEMNPAMEEKIRAAEKSFSEAISLNFSGIFLRLIRTTPNASKDVGACIASRRDLLYMLAADLQN